MASEVGLATVFVGHAWLYEFEWLVSALEAAKMPASTRFWVDVAVVNQHVNSTKGFDWWSTTFRSAVGKIGTTLLVLAPWNAPIPLRRAWCIWCAPLPPPPAQPPPMYGVIITWLFLQTNENAPGVPTMS